MKKTYLIFIFFLCAANLSSAQNIDSILKHAVKSFMASGSRIGLSAAVIKNNETYQYNFGSTDIKKSSAPTSETIYEIGSITKTFTSMLLAQAIVDKKINLNDDIRKYLNDSYLNLEYNGKPIKILHLANLTSGLPNNLPENIPAFKSLDKDSQLFEFKRTHDNYTKTQFLRDLKAVKLTKEPGLSPAHSNTAAELLGFILENIYKKGYSELLKQYLTDPSGMKSTFVLVPDNLKEQVAKGYNDKGVLMPEVPIDAGGAGVLKSTLSDMIKYTDDQLRENDERVKINHTLTWGNIDNLGIGLNWSIKTNFDGERKLWASGGTFGFSSYIVLYPDRKFAIIIFTNESDNGAQDAAAKMAQTIYNEVFFTASERASEGFGYSKPINILVNILNKRGFEYAIETAKELKQKHTSFKLIEEEVNMFGYSILYKGDKKKALEIFKLNVHLFPKSGNTYDSLAETYESLGDKTSAIKNYKLSLEFNPANGNAEEHLKKLGGL